MTLGPVAAILFDKDGTLFDFHATWSVWAAEVIANLAGGDRGRMAALASAWDYDLEAGRFRDRSPVVAATNAEVARRAAAVLPGSDAGQIEMFLARAAADAPLVEVVPLADYLAGLRRRGFRLGVMSNDSAVSVGAQLRRAGVAEAFDFVAGADSGHGAKPDAAPLLAFARAVGAAPAEVVMVGDSTHDLLAGRAAGTATVGVLTGTAPAEQLVPLADLVLPSIADLPDHLPRTSSEEL